LETVNGQNTIRKTPHYLIIHNTDGRKGKILVNNNFIRVKLKNDGGKVYGPFQVDSNFIYTATDTVLVDSILLFKTFQPGVALLGISTIVPAMLVLSVIAPGYYFTFVSDPIVWLVTFSPFIVPLLFIVSSIRRYKIVSDVRIEGRNKYPWHLSKEKASIPK